MDLEKKFDILLVEIKKICDKIDNKFEQIDKRFVQIDERFDKLEKRFDNLEKRFDKFEEKNEAEHRTMYNMISSLNSAFLSFEAQNSFRISNLEQHIFNQN